MQQAIGDQLGQPSQPTMVQSQPQLVQQQHLVQQQQMLQGQQQMLQPQQQQLLQQQQILQSQQHIMQPQQQMLQSQQILQGQQQMLQGQQQLMQQMMPQQLGQQMMYCPVRLVYDTPVLMQGDQMQQQNHSLYVNQPPWARQVQNQVIYVQQIGPNLVPVQHLDPNIYLHQNLPMYQQVVQNVPQIVQNITQNVQQVRPVANNIPGIVQNFGANVQEQNVAQLQNLGFIQANQNANNANANVNNEERRVASPMAQQNAQNQDINQVYRQVLTQATQQQRPLIQMTNQVQNVQTNTQIAANIGQNTNTNRLTSNNATQVTQNVPTSVNQMRQITAPTTVQNTNQNVRMVTSNVGTHVTNVAQNMNANMPQVRHVMPQAVSYAPRGVHQQNLQNMTAQSTAGNVNTVTYSAVRNGQPYTYRAIQPKPNANVRNYTPRAQGPTPPVRKPVPNLIQTSVANTSVANTAPAQASYVKTETESPLFNKKRKSESPDETQKKISNFGSVTVTSQMKDKTKAKYGVHTSEIGVNTSPVHKPKVPTDNQNSKNQQPLLQINPMEAKIKQEAKPAETTPVLHNMKTTFSVKTEAPVDGNIQQTLIQTNQAEDWYAKYLLEQKQDPKNDQIASQQNQHPTPQYHMIIQQPTGQQITVQYPAHMTIQPQPSQQMTLLHPPKSQQMTMPQPMHMPVQLLPNQQMNLQMPMNQPMAMQHPTNQPMAMQHPTNQQMAIPPTSQPMTTLPQKPPKGQQMTSQQPTNQPLNFIPLRPKKDMSQQTEEKLVRKTVYSQATTRGRLLDDTTNSNTPRLEELKPSNVETMNMNLANPHVPNIIPIAATPKEVPHVPIKPVEPTKKLEEKRTIAEESKSLPMLPTTIDDIPKVAPIKKDIVAKPAAALEQKKELNTTANMITSMEQKKEPNTTANMIISMEQKRELNTTANMIISMEQKKELNTTANTMLSIEQKKELNTTANMTTISDTLKEIIRDTIAKKEETKSEPSKNDLSTPSDSEKTKKVATVKAETNTKIEKPNPTPATDVPKALDSIKKDIKGSETKISTDFEKVIKDNKIEKKEKKEYKDIPIKEMSGKEIHMVDGSIRKEVKEKDYILTHVLDGFVIQESNVPFAVRRPLKERTVNAVGEEKEKEKQDPSMKNLTKEEMKDKILELSQLHLEDGRERKEVEKQNEEAETIKENDENKPADDVVNSEVKDAVTANPFEDLNHNVVKSWTVEDLTSHLMKHNWTETVSLLQEHEIDGESIFLVTKNQLVTIGLNETHAELICDFVGNKN